nr:MAG TPA: hypothetical protein [Caudoviricetes sp.]
MIYFSISLLLLISLIKKSGRRLCRCPLFFLL